MEASSAGKREYEDKGSELNIGRIWAAGFQPVKAHCCLARVLKRMNSFFFLAAVNREY
jgi:hypothetical protein